MSSPLLGSVHHNGSRAMLGRQPVWPDSPCPFQSEESPHAQRARPKIHLFPGFFEDHRGNLQEWIKFTENVAPVNKVENEEEDCALEEVPVVQLVKAKVEAPMTGPLCPQMQMGEALGPGLHPLQPPQHSDVVTLGGFSFVVDDDAYLML
nr:cytokine receptor-like factor 2 [Loxodonta africana]